MLMADMGGLRVGRPLCSLHSGPWSRVKGGMRDVMGGRGRGNDPLLSLLACIAPFTGGKVGMGEVPRRRRLAQRPDPPPPRPSPALRGRESKAGSGVGDLMRPHPG